MNNPKPQPNEQKTYWCIAENLDECLYLADNIIPCEPYKTTLSLSRDMASYVFSTEAEAWDAYTATIQRMLNELNAILVKIVRDSAIRLDAITTTASLSVPNEI